MRKLLYRENLLLFHEWILTAAGKSSEHHAALYYTADVLL